MFGGTSSIPTCKGKENLAPLTKACATLLPCLLVWEREKVLKEPTIDLKSLTKWPAGARTKSLINKAYITPAALPSKITCWKPSSTTNTVALLVATVSSTYTDEGRAIFSDNAAMTSPFSFQITKPTLASPKSTKTAPAKFAFISPGAGGFHLARASFGFGPRIGSFCWNLDSNVEADSKTLWMGKLCSLHLNLFLRNHTDQATIANTSSLADSLRTTLIKSETDLSWEYWPRSQEKFGNHTGWRALQLQRAWKESSGAIWHSLHNVLSNTFLFCKLTFVGRASKQARYRKIFALFGTLGAVWSPISKHSVQCLNTEH